MTRTLFVGEPTRARPRASTASSPAAQDVVFAALDDAVAAAQSGAELPTGRSYDQMARDFIEADGRWPVYGHGLGHGIGLATHELPGLGRRSPDVPLPATDGLLGRARDLPRGRDGRADRGPRRHRRRRRPGRAGHAVPARRGRRRGLGATVDSRRAGRRHRQSAMLCAAACNLIEPTVQPALPAGTHECFGIAEQLCLNLGASRQEDEPDPARGRLPSPLPDAACASSTRGPPRSRSSGRTAATTSTGRSGGECPKLGRRSRPLQSASPPDQSARSSVP